MAARNNHIIFVLQVMANRKTATQMLAEACGKPFDEVLEDSSRTFYLSPDEAVEYGLIDKVTYQYPPPPPGR